MKLSSALAAFTLLALASQPAARAAQAPDAPNKKTASPKKAEKSKAAKTAAAAETRSTRKPITYEEYDLPNGLHVILHPNHSVPVVSSYVLYRVGSKNERQDRTGFAHFFEHLMFEGSEYIPRGTIDKYISGAGGNLNASTSFDQTDYYFNLPAHQLRLALWIESERMLHPRIDETGVETQRAVVKEERRRSYDNQPYGSLFEELSSLVFEGTPYQWVPIGSFQYIDQASIEEFRAFHKNFYLPENATLVVAGDFQPTDARNLIAEYFSDIPRGSEIPRPRFDWKFDVEGKSKDVERKNTPLPAIVHAWRAPSETDPDAYPLEMLSVILGKGRSSRLYQSLVEKKGLAMSAVPYCYLLEKAGVFALSVTGQAGVSLEELHGVLQSEITEVVQKGVTDEELQKARNAMEAQYAESGGTMHERASALAHYHAFYGDTSLINTELDRYLAVTRDDIHRVARKYLTEKGRYSLRFPVPAAK
jgi:predicted Zn-dependent peptidase